MGIVFRQSVKTSIVTFAGALLGAVTIYLGAKFIPKQQLGFVRNTLPELAVLIAQMLPLGLNLTMLVYVHKFAPTDKRRTALISMNFIAPAVLLLLLLPFYLGWKENIVALFQEADQALVSKFYLWLPLCTLLFVYMFAFEQYLMSQQKLAASTFMREVLLRVFTIVLILLFGYNLLSFSVLVPATVLIMVIPNIFLLVLAFKTEHFRVNFNWNVFSRDEKKDLVNFTWYHFLLTVTINMMAKIDIILLAMWSSLSAAAVYGIAVYILSFLQIPYRAMINASFPVLTKAYHDNDMEKVRDVFVRSSLNILIASAGLAVIICCNLHNAVALLPGYEASATLVLILTIGKMVDLSTGMNDQLLSISNYYRFTFIVSVTILFLLIAFNYFLIPRYSYFGAALATTFAVIIYNVSKLVFIHVRLGLLPYTSKSLLVIAAALVAAAAGYFMPTIANPFADAFIRSLLIAAIYLGMLMLLKPSEDLNGYLKSIKQNKRLF